MKINQKKLACIHEAAHAHAYHFFGHKVERIFVEEDFTGLTQVYTYFPSDNYLNDKDLINKIYNYGIICLIGRVAEFISLDAILGLNPKSWYQDSLNNLGLDGELDDGTSLLIQFQKANKILGVETFGFKEFEIVVGNTIGFLDNDENWNSILKLSELLEQRDYSLQGRDLDSFLYTYKSL